MRIKVAHFLTIYTCSLFNHYCLKDTIKLNNIFRAPLAHRSLYTHTFPLEKNLLLIQYGGQVPDTA